jgi:aminopeptidase N
MKDGIEEYWSPLVADAYKQHKALIARQNEMLKPVESAIGKLKALISTYEYEEERKRKEAERIAAEALRKQQEAEAMLEAQRLQAAGDAMGAESVIEQAIAAPPPPVILQSTVPQVQGKSSRQQWKFRVTNEALIPREYLCVDEQKLGAVVRALKDKTRIPGIEVYPDPVVSFRA